LSEEAGAGAASGAGRVMERALDATLRDPRVELR
jgi:F0F1-type ATP synthase membrane subunit c/vacuolar-type H+-ATPase subunit K